MILSTIPDHQALVFGALEVALKVTVAFTGEGKRRFAVHELFAGTDADARVAGARLVVGFGNVDPDAAQVVDDLLEFLEVDFHVVGNGHAGPFRIRLQLRDAPPNA